MSDLRDFTGKNRRFTGTDSVQLPKGTTGERVASGSSDKGKIRYNTTTELAEYYNGTEWKPIDSPPTVTSVSPSEVESADGGNTTFTITGGNFQSGATVKFIGNDGTEVTADSVTIDSSSQITAVETSNSFANAKEPYDVKITNASGLSAELADSINVDNPVTWSTSAGSLGTIAEDATGTHFTVSATDADSDTITYSETTSVLSGAGLTLDSSTGAISGDPTDGQNTYNFTLRASAGGKTADRAFSITVEASPTGGTVTNYTYSSQGYKVHTFTSSGSFVLPSSKSVDILVTAGGGSGGGGQASNHGAGGGAGGVVFRAAKTLNAATYTVTVGGGGSWSDSRKDGEDGGNSVFTGDGYTLTGEGGGGGSGLGNTGQNTSLMAGGSGGGAGRDAGNRAGGVATQGNGGDGSATGYGNDGGVATGTGCTSGGGGGGAGGVGQNGCYDCQTARQGTCSEGGVGVTNFINTSTAETAAMLYSAQIGTNSSNQLVSGLGSNPGTIYIAGGGGASYEVDTASNLPPGGIGGGGRGGSRYPNGGGQQGSVGLTNTGGGGGAGQRYNNGGQGANGAAGHVIIRYTT